MSKPKTVGRRPKIRIIYQENYVRGALPLKNPEALPILQHTYVDGKKFEADACEVMAAGIMEIDGKRIEFQDLRVFLKPTQER